ncbi:MAG: hypothetical protein LHV68_08345 [Elusimicrobia bacterium]|nr:hypothetical protein [Candidatus Liberimonas magnetica]
MPFIKSVLKEELKNSISMKKGYEKALSKLPNGSLRAKKITGKVYYYLAKRENGKFKDVYLGSLSEKEIKMYKEGKEKRAKYRKLLSQVKKQIKFIKGTIRGKEAI